MPYGIVGIMKYYAVQVATRHEKNFIEQSERCLKAAETAQLLPSSLPRFIFPERLMKIRRQGKNTTELQPLFAGYVFLELEDAVSLELFQLLRHQQYFFRFLKSNQEIVPLRDNDLAILQHFISLGVTALPSKVFFDENDKISVISGPLKGLEGNIIKVDKRKHRAKVQVEFAESQITFDLSFDMMQKEVTQ